MLSSNLRRRKKYPFWYKIYRRFRFMRYKKRLQKKSSLELALKQKQEEEQIRLNQRQFTLSEKQQARIKRKADRLEAKKIKRQHREEFRQSHIQARQEWKKLSMEDRARARKTRLEEKKQKREQRRAAFKYHVKSFFHSLRSINKQSVKNKISEFRSNTPKRKRFLVIAVNSTVFFLLSYFTLFLISQAVTVIAASFFDYPTIVYYYQIYFNISPEAWFSDSVKTIFASGPLVNFILGITFFIVYHKFKESDSSFKLFFLWGFLHAVNMLFGAMLIGTLFEAGVGHVISWMYIMDTGKVLYSTISLFLLVVAGLVATKPFLISGNTYYNEINTFNRKSFIIAQVLLPYLAGNALLIILRQPHFVLYDTFTLITLIVCIIPILVTYRTFNELYFEEDGKKARIAWISMLVLGLIIVFFRLVLEKGIRIGG